METFEYGNGYYAWVGNRFYAAFETTRGTLGSRASSVLEFFNELGADGWRIGEPEKTNLVAENSWTELAEALRTAQEAVARGFNFTMCRRTS